MTVTIDHDAADLRAFAQGVERAWTDLLDPTEEELREHVRANLARFKVPREVRFVDELPRGPTGKIQHDDLRKHL
jgi:acyl-coenzyme A synthetase/AMP-(fatty) acid ligase